MQSGDPNFYEEITRLYPASENNALEGLVGLKSKLRELPNDEFWSAVTEGLSDILGAEMAFAFKRVLVDDQESAVEMPPLGEPGSCMMAAAFHYCSNDGAKDTIKQSKFHAYGCPCAYMRHDKVFIIPEQLNDFITDNPNKLPMPAEAYIAVPLFAEGKCFAHFGAMWSKDGAAQRKLSWAFIEMLLHSLEDMMLQRFLEGANFIRPAASIPHDRPRVIPHEAVTVAQSLRPYAGSLSHELRTPMQGVVGMLDVMYATVQEAVDTQSDPKLKQIFEALKENIEVVQDSSRRAVEAADNVVHAYDMNMSVPEGPAPLPVDESNDTASPYSTTAAERRPEILVAGSNLPLSRPNKRRREDSLSRHGPNVDISKYRRVGEPHLTSMRSSELGQEILNDLQQARSSHAPTPADLERAHRVLEQDAEMVANGAVVPTRIIAPGLRHTNMREVFQYVINEGLKMGGRPDSAMAQETEHGESIEVRSRGSDGSISTKTIDWHVDPGVPHTMFTDEKDLTKLVSCVFLNAVKFTDEVDGSIAIQARMSSRGRYVSVKISDNGPGIPTAFLPKLFKPFSQGNGSLTRSSEGLGLGLMVAKGIARKLGGDLLCTRAETEGPRRGSEFEIRVPVIAGETISRPSSPFGSPMPRRAHGSISDPPHMPPLPSAPASPRRLSRALHEVVNEGPLSCNNLPPPHISSPASPTHHLVVPPTSCQDHPTSSPSSPRLDSTRPRRRVHKSVSNIEADYNLAQKYPVTFLVAEDNKINRKLLVHMLHKLGYRNIHEAHNGAEAVRQMSVPRPAHDQIDVVLMDLWMPLMDGYEATERILSMNRDGEKRATVLAVTADVTDGALERAAKVGMTGFMTKPYKMVDLQKLIVEYSARASVTAEEDMDDGIRVSVCA